MPHEHCNRDAECATSQDEKVARKANIEIKTPVRTPQPVVNNYLIAKQCLKNYLVKEVQMKLQKLMLMATLFSRNKNKCMQKH